MSTLKQRFADLALEQPGISQADIARATGAKPPSVNAWFNGDTKTMKLVTATKASALYGVNPLWLSSGEGPKRPLQPTAAPDYKPNNTLAGESIASGAININVNRQAPQSAHDVATALVSLMARVEPGHRDAVASLLSSLARNPADPLLTEMLVKILDPAAFTQPEQRTG